MATANQYGAVAPAAVDPFPIESTLAQIVGQNNPAEAYNMLKTYQTQNQTSQGNYDYALQGQHEFAKQQLAQQLKEQYIKSAMDAVQHPGGLSVLQGMAPDALANVDPGVIGGVETGLARAQDASTFEKGASGAYHSVQAGFQPNATRLATLTGGVTGAAGTPLQMQIEAMKEAHADKRAAAASADAGQPSVSAIVMGPYGQENWSVPSKRGGVTGLRNAMGAAGIPLINAGQPGSAPLPDEAARLAPPPPPGSPPSPPPGRGTSLPPNAAQPAARPATPPKTPAPNNTAVGVPAYQAAVGAHIEDFKNKSWYPDVKAGMAANHGLAIVKPGSGGGMPVLYGASGKVINPASD